MVSRHRSTARDPVTTSGGTSRSVHGLCQRHCGDLRMAADCEYVRDPVHERDFWQHPKTFEQLRKGDCEDHALWAWRKLTELGISAYARRSSKRLSSALCDRRAIQFRRVWRLYAIPETGTR